MLVLVLEYINIEITDFFSNKTTEPSSLFPHLLEKNPIPLFLTVLISKWRIFAEEIRREMQPRRLYLPHFRGQMRPFGVLQGTQLVYVN